MDPAFSGKRLASGILDFGEGVSTFTCGTQLAFYQRVNILGDRGRVRSRSLQPSQRPPLQGLGAHEGDRRRGAVGLRPLHHPGRPVFPRVINDTPSPHFAAGSIGNMRVIESIIKSSQTAAGCACNRPPHSARAPLGQLGL